MNIFFSGGFEFINIFFMNNYLVSSLRPFARLLFKIRLPFLLLIRAKNPCFFAFLRLFG